MPHATHFLERLDRVPRSLTDFALDLYRDEDRIKWIIHYAHLPKDVERVALALAHTEGGPHIVVTREGKFVTALGAGMRTSELKVLTRAQVDAFSARVDEARARFELAKEVVTPGKRPADMIGLLTTRAWGLSREEFSAIAAWVPLLNLHFLKEIFEAISTMDSFRELYLAKKDKAFRKHPRTRETLESMWNLSHGIAARYLLATMGELVWAEDFAADWNEDYGPTWYATDERIFSVTVRGAWAAARWGKAFLPTYKRILSTPGDISVRFDAVLALTAIGLRHAHLKDDARRIITLLLKSEPEGNLAWAKKVVGFSDRAFDDPEGALGEVAAFGSKVLLALAPHLAEGSPFRFATEADVPRELALSVIVNQTLESLHPFSLYVLPWVAKLASPEALYYPEELAVLLREPLSAENMIAVYERQNVGAAPQPVTRDAPKLGRNDPCSCGSGKKLKRCCGS